jgi:hypothetical protein
MVSYCFDCRFFWRKHKKVTSRTVSYCLGSLSQTKYVYLAAGSRQVLSPTPIQICQPGKIFSKLKYCTVFDIVFFIQTSIR